MDQFGWDAGLTTNAVRVPAVLALVFTNGTEVRLVDLLRPAIPPQEQRVQGSLATWGPC